MTRREHASTEREQVKRPQDHVVDIDTADELPHRVLINTSPKAGTYLLASIVEQLGFRHSYYHLQARKLQAYDRNDLDQGLKHPRRFDVPLELSESRKLIRSGELAVGHLEHSREREHLFRNFRIILAQREIRSALVSYARMLGFAGKAGPELTERIGNEGVSALIADRGAGLLRTIERMIPWRDCGNVLFVRFEDLHADPLNVTGAISEFLGVQVDDPSETMRRARDKHTFTKSQRFPDLSWDDAAEELFERLGGPELNRRLGYENE